MQKDVVDSALFTGRTEADKFVEIRARVQGWLNYVWLDDEELKKRLADEGKDIWDVTADQILFRIEPEPYISRLKEARATKAQAEAAVALADANVRRAAPLVEKGAITKEDFDTREAELRMANSKQMEAQARIDLATIDLNYTLVKSPMDGRASRNLVDFRKLVGSGEDTLLCTVVKTDPMYVYFDVTEKDVLRLLQSRREAEQDDDNGEDPTVYLGLANEEGYPHEGTIDYLDNQVDPNTGTAVVRAVFPNPAENRYLYPGLFVRIRLPLRNQPNAVLVDEKAIGTDLGGKFVLVVRDKDGKKNIVEQRYVELGTLTEGMRVIRTGLAADERYITEGLQRARPGLPVRPETKKPPKTSEPEAPTDPAKPAAPTETPPADKLEKGGPAPSR